MHPLSTALEASGITQEELSALIEDLGWKWPDGRPLRLSQPSISLICRFKRAVSPRTAEAIAAALSGRAEITAADIAFAKQPAIAQKPKTKKPARHRAA